MTKLDVFRIVVGSGALFFLVYLMWKRLFVRTEDFFSNAFFRSQQIKKIKNNLREGKATPGLRPGTEREYIRVLRNQRTQNIALGALLIVFTIVFLGVVWLILPF